MSERRMMRCPHCGSRTVETRTGSAKFSRHNEKGKFPVTDCQRSLTKQTAEDLAVVAEKYRQYQTKLIHQQRSGYESGLEQARRRLTLATEEVSRLEQAVAGYDKRISDLAEKSVDELIAMDSTRY